MIRNLEQAWLMLKMASALPDFSVSNVPARLGARTTTASFSVREAKMSGWDFSCTATRIPGRSTSAIVEMRTAGDEVAEFDLHVKRGEVPLLRARKGDVPSAGFPAVQQGCDGWVRNPARTERPCAGPTLSRGRSQPLSSHPTRSPESQTQPSASGKSFAWHPPWKSYRCSPGAALTLRFAIDAAIAAATRKMMVYPAK